MLRTTKRKLLLVLLAAPLQALPADVPAAQAVVSATACAMITKADVDAAFAPRVFAEGAKGVGDFAGTAKLASVTSCSFTSRGASFRDLLTVDLLVRRAPTDASGTTVATAKDGAVKLKMTPIDVAGLGDAAYWVNMGSAKRPIIQLNVFTGKRTWLIYGATAAGLEVDKALASLTRVAQATLARF
jgi:hypothetical protein